MTLGAGAEASSYAHGTLLTVEQLSLEDVAAILAMTTRLEQMAAAERAKVLAGRTVALLFYGVHSHLQQIPIYCGQLQYWLNRRKGKRARLLEYKQP